MAVRRRRSSAAKGPTGPSSRVHSVESLEQWQSMLSKAAKGGRLVVLQLFQASNYACAQMRAVFKRMSVDPQLRAAVFAEVEVDVAEEDLLEECGMVQGNTRIPCYRCYVDGQEVESYSGGQPNQVAAMIQRQLAELRASRGGWLPKLLLAAGSAAALAAGLYWHFGRGGGSGGGSKGAPKDLGEELRVLGERIRLAQTRKRNCERAGKLKGARNQARLLRQLDAQRRQVEQQLHQREHPEAAAAAAGAAEGADSSASASAAPAAGGSGGGGSSGGGRRSGGRKKGRSGSGSGRQAGQGPSPLPWGMEPTDCDSEGEEQARSGGSGSRRQRRAPAAVLYSDEEE